MMLCRVKGNVVATVKHDAFLGHKLCIVQPLDHNGDDSGISFLAVDHAQAGEGDRVLVMREGNGVRQILGTKVSPIRSLIVGIVDDVVTDVLSVVPSAPVAIATTRAGRGRTEAP